MRIECKWLDWGHTPSKWWKSNLIPNAQRLIPDAKVQNWLHVGSIWVISQEIDDPHTYKGECSFLHLTLFKEYVIVLTARAICRLHPVWLLLPSDRHGSELFKSWEWFGWIMSADYEFLVCGPQLLVMNQSATQGEFWSRAHFCIMRSKVVRLMVSAF